MSDAMDISHEAVEHLAAEITAGCAAMDEHGERRLDPLTAPVAVDPMVLLHASAMIRALRAALDAAEAERDGWKETARLFSEGSDGFRAWLVQIGELFGREAHIADDGSDMQKVLVAKVPELVAALKAERDKLRAELADRRRED